MKMRERVAVQFDPEAGAGREPPASRREREGVNNDVFALPGPMGVESVGEVRHGRRDVGHRRQADPEVGVGVHGEPQVERVADGGQVLDLFEAAPVMVIGQDDADGSLVDGSGMSSKPTTHMLVARGIGTSRATAAIPDESRRGIF